MRSWGFSLALSAAASPPGNLSFVKACYRLVKIFQSSSILMKVYEETKIRLIDFKTCQGFEESFTSLLLVI